MRVGLHGPQTTMLPAKPHLGAGVIIIVGSKGEAVLLVVAARQVAENGAALPDGEAAVIVVDDDGDAAVRVQGDEPGLLLDELINVDGLGGVL